MAQAGGPGNSRAADADGSAEGSGTGRAVHILGMVLIGVVLPAVLVGVLVGALGVSALFTGSCGAHWVQSSGARDASPT